MEEWYPIARSLAVTRLTHFHRLEIVQPGAPWYERDFRLAWASGFLPHLVDPFSHSAEPNLSLIRGGNVCLFGHQALISMSSPLAQDLALVFEGFDAGFNNDLERGRKLREFSGAFS